MIVRYMRERRSTVDGPDYALTFGKEYLVVGTIFYVDMKKPHKISVRCDDDGTPCLFDLSCFDFVDSRIPDNWICERVSNFIYDLTPLEFSNDFWDKYHDGDEEAEKIFEGVMQRIHEFHYP